MKLWRKLLLSFSLFFRRIRSEFRGIRRQIPYLLMHGWPKFILAASKADADACAAPMAFLLAHKLTVNQVWWRKVQAGEEHTPRGFEHFVKAVHFDTARKFDGEVIDGKLVKSGKWFFDHHHDPKFLNHCATSLVIESFGLKDPVLGFLGEYVRLIDTGNPGSASRLLQANTNGGPILQHIITIDRFFEVIGEPEMQDLVGSVGIALRDLRWMLQNLKTVSQYGEELRQLEACEHFFKALVSRDFAFVKTNFASAKKACAALIKKLVDPDPSHDGELYLAVYGIHQSNAKILNATSALVTGLKSEISYGEQLRNGCLAFRSFYNQESVRQKVLRDMLPGGNFKKLYLKTESGDVLRVVVADNAPYDGTTMRVVIRQSFYDSIDLIVCGSPNGQVGLILVDERRRHVPSLRKFRDLLVKQHPIYASSFLHSNEFVLYLKTPKDAKGKISFDEVVKLLRELVEVQPKVEVAPTVQPSRAVTPAQLRATIQITQV